MTFMPGRGFTGNTQDKEIRLGGPVFEKFADPETWVRLLKKQGYRAALCPVGLDEADALIELYRKAAEKNDIVIAETGAWCNPIDPDQTKAAQAIEKCIRSLVLAEKIGARCCVNISGSRNPARWDGPHKDNLTQGTFDLIVETTRKIIDAVKPSHTFFTLEPMPWAYPDTADSYLRLIKAIDRKNFAVHFDPVNMVTSPQIIYSNGDMISDAFRKLGRYIRSCHAKDVMIREDTSQSQIAEVRPGLGILNYEVYLAELAKLTDVPLIIEHLSTEEEYNKAAVYIRSIGNAQGIRM
jgi:sugar phosphate isomerase/epimerase